MALKSALIRDLYSKSSGFTDFENTVDRGSTVIFEVDSRLCLSYVRILGPKGNLGYKKIWIIDLSSALDGMLMSLSKLFFFFERSSYKFRCDTVIGIVLCCCHQACCLLYYLAEINSGIHMYQFTIKPLDFCFRMWLWFRI